ncbi:YheC/D like ATP-grasp [Paenibacillus uliginis N3/975]|uniref:YheC/D like ATP-grasp n=1 Tax=Paenibacillus uliginis N3/975 TaxID=1313296 RepID=A0A1X7HUP8_9BACL|nr:YheC/YheD family protein [Paenibacillus uliginis]SMF92754.1 YheC/D like ATP-grasp [Paenibacillus uliginis N3/975]
MTVQRVSSKWTKTKNILKNKGLASYVPATRLYSFDALEQMLETHTLVYIKPDRGTYGNGVMCVELIHTEEPDSSDSTQSYELRYDTTTEHYTTLEQLHNTITHLCHGKEYLIQQGIRLLQHNGRAFDLRVLVQKNPFGRWESTGIVGRVAAQHKIVTNHHGGGSIQHFKKLMTEHMTSFEADNIRKELKDLGINVASQLQRSYPNLKEIGLDVAIDSRWSIWILEVNTKPALYPFKKFFKDQSIYQKVKKYANAYGRSTSSKKKAT